MLQLVKKDFVIHKTMLCVMLAALILYIIADASTIILGILFSFAMTMHIFAPDEKRSVQILLSSLPVTRKEIVSSKYIAAFLYISFVVFGLIAGNFIIHQEQPNWTHLSFIMVVSLLSVAIFYPICYKFTSKFLMIICVVGFVIYLLVVNVFIHDFNDQFRAIVSKIMTLMESQTIVFALITALILYSISWLVSIKIYEKKVF